MTTVYIAGPMRGKEYYNAHEFNRAEKALKAKGFEVINPVANDKERGVDLVALPDSTDWTSLPPAASLRNIAMDCCLGVIDSDAIYLLDGWQGSRGAQAEAALAKWLGLEFMYD